MLCLCRTLLLDPQRAVIITWVTVRMMQVAFYQVVDMVPMGRPLMAALGTMNMPFLVASAVVVSCASVGIRCVHFEHVLIHMVPVHMVQVPVMQVVGVPVMADGLVPAVRPVLVRVVSMRLAFVHHNPSVDDVHYARQTRTSRPRRLSGVIVLHSRPSSRRPLAAMRREVKNPRGRLKIVIAGARPNSISGCQRSRNWPSAVAGVKSRKRPRQSTVTDPARRIDR